MKEIDMAVDTSGLNDAERAAMEDADDSEVNAMLGGGVQDLNPSDDDDDDAEAPAPAEAPAEAAEAPDEAEGIKDFTPLFNAPAVEDFDAKITALKAEESELREKLESGDIDIAQYDEEKTRILEERADLKAEQRLADFAAQQNEANQRARWQWEQERFFAAESSALYKDPLLFAALDAAVKASANDPANANRSSGWFLEQADKQVRKLFAAAAAPAAEEKPAAPAAPARRNAPVTLANLPAASLPETGASDEFAKLERMSGMELERQLSRMSKDEVDRYLRAA